MPAIDIGLVTIGGLDWQRRPRQRRGPFAKATRSAPQGSSFAFLPYAAGLLEAYVARHAPDPSRYSFRMPIFRRAPVDVNVAALEGVDVAGFSVYCWNFELSIATAKALKARCPATLIVFGGPHVSDQGGSFLDQHPFIDIAVHGEGEATFLSLLENLGDPHAPLDGATVRGVDGRTITRPKPPRIKDLDAIPSPYLEGTFDRVIAGHRDLRWHALWETNRGCPFACTFCDWGSATASKVYQFSMDRVRAEVEWFERNRIEFVFGCDANFGILPRDVEIARHVAASHARSGFPASMGLQNTKNATERSYQVQSLLAALSPTGVTISLQSVDPHTLESIKRDNISTSSFQELQRRYTRDGIETYTDIIIGLPGETYDSLANGVSTVIANGQHHRIQFYNCYILPNAEMAQPAYRERYGLVTARSRVIDAHRPITPPDGHVDEWMELVIATASMPAEDWVRAKAFAWMTDLLHCDRVLQVAFSALHAAYGFDFRSMIEAICAADPEQYPVAASLHARFAAHARGIQAGESELIPSEEWLGVFWPSDEIALIDLVTTHRIEMFYEEARRLLRAFVAARVPGADFALVDDAIALNAALLRVPFEVNDLDLALSYDLWECHRDLVTGTPRPPVARPSRYRIVRTDPIWLDCEDWCEDVLARFKRKSAFLYPITRLEDCSINADQTPFHARLVDAPDSAAAGGVDRRAT